MVLRVYSGMQIVTSLGMGHFQDNPHTILEGTFEKSHPPCQECIGGH